MVVQKYSTRAYSVLRDSENVEGGLQVFIAVPEISLIVSLAVAFIAVDSVVTLHRLVTETAAA